MVPSNNYRRHAYEILHRKLHLARQRVEEAQASLQEMYSSAYVQEQMNGAWKETRDEVLALYKIDLDKAQDDDDLVDTQRSHDPEHSELTDAIVLEGLNLNQADIPDADEDEDDEDPAYEGRRNARGKGGKHHAGKEKKKADKGKGKQRATSDDDDDQSDDTTMALEKSLGMEQGPEAEMTTDQMDVDQGSTSAGQKRERSSSGSSQNTSKKTQKVASNDATESPAPEPSTPASLPEGDVPDAPHPVDWTSVQSRRRLPGAGSSMTVNTGMSKLSSRGRRAVDNIEALQNDPNPAVRSMAGVLAAALAEKAQIAARSEALNKAIEESAKQLVAASESSVAGSQAAMSQRGDTPAPTKSSANPVAPAHEKGGPENPIGADDVEILANENLAASMKTVDLSGGQIAATREAKQEMLDLPPEVLLRKAEQAAEDTSGKRVQPRIRRGPEAGSSESFIRQVVQPATNAGRSASSSSQATSATPTKAPRKPLRGKMRQDKET
ncbi:hypothetical protein K474DRAFT_1714219 [Panus rudis PR-1116 ss-1]|nr:hypothetical protein K474DRAFT_1714219 [Panus rudis PR-1116 ss-1]